MLLQDGEQHLQHKELWREPFAKVVTDAGPVIRDVTSKAFVAPLKKLAADVPLDLYETLKALSWEILLAVFLGLERESASKEFRNVEELQESVLRGQFSLFPVAVRTPFWTSPRSRGLQAVQKLEPALRQQLRSQWERSTTACPFAQHTTPAKDSEGDTLSEEAIVSHTRLFTSSIANKALASLLTAYFMNLFLWRDRSQPDRSLADLIAQSPDRATRSAILSSTLTETLRLSPPVIGVMRRVTQAVCLNNNPGVDEGLAAAGYTIPAGHDAWLYFVGANRDPGVFSHANEFRWDRFMQSGSEVSAAEEGFGIAFGLGPKRCLGAELVRLICLTAAETLMEAGVALKGGAQVEEGVRAWLGWEAEAGPDVMARDLKQLPCQRPRGPVMVTVARDG